LGEYQAAIFSGAIMHPRLSPGEFYGQVTRQRMVAGLHLIETRYAPGTRLPRHCHEHGYVCLVRRGHYQEKYGGRERSCGPLTVAFHAPGELHAEHFADDETWSFNIEMTSAWLARWREVEAQLDWSADFQGGSLAALALRLYREFLHSDEAAPLAIEGLALEMLAEAWRGSPRRVKPTPPRWLVRVRELLDDHFAKRLTLAELAQSADVHPVHLAAAFHRQYGCTVGQYVRRRRIEYACGELTSSAADLAQIALRAGFADQSHFCRTFKRLTGLTPAAYRQAARLA
jgi:AraC family transcriptional regulator